MEVSAVGVLGLLLLVIIVDVDGLVAIGGLVVGWKVGMRACVGFDVLGMLLLFVSIVVDGILTIGE